MIEALFILFTVIMLTGVYAIWLLILYGLRQKRALARINAVRSRRIKESVIRVQRRAGNEHIDDRF